MTFTERYQKKLARYRQQNAAARRQEQAMSEPVVTPLRGRRLMRATPSCGCVFKDLDIPCQDEDCTLCAKEQKVNQ